MTDQEINEAIAVSLGWKAYPYVVINGIKYDDRVYWAEGDFNMDDPPPGTYAFRQVPSCVTNLMAMREVELKLTTGEWRIFIGFLGGRRTIPQLMSMDEFHECWNATARQRAEAYLRTIGKWKD